MRALKALVARVAGYIVRREPVRTAGWLAGVVLGVIGWFAVPNSQTEQIVETVCGVLAPVVAAELSRLAAWSPASHTASIATGAHVAPPPATAEPAGGGV